MTNAGASLLQVADLEVQYPGGGAPAVLGASLHVDRGDLVVVVGANGAGKTSLVRAIAGYLPNEGVTTRGSIRLAGKEIRGQDPSRLAKRGICFVPERNKIFRGLTVDQNLRLFGTRRRSAAGLDDDRAGVFELFPWLEQRRSTLAGYLSGGQQQMLALSGVVLARPDLVVVDEPSLGLAPIVVQQVMDRLRTLRAELDVGVLLVDQNVSSTVPLADRVYSMHAGHLTEEAKDEMLQRVATVGYARRGEPDPAVAT